MIGGAVSRQDAACSSCPGCWARPCRPVLLGRCAPSLRDWSCGPALALLSQHRAHQGAPRPLLAARLIPKKSTRGALAALTARTDQALVRRACALARPRQRGSQVTVAFKRRASKKPLSRRLSRRLRYEAGRTRHLGTTTRAARAAQPIPQSPTNPPILCEGDLWGDKHAERARNSGPYARCLGPHPSPPGP